jgi:hypothetical protein
VPRSPGRRPRWSARLPVLLGRDPARTVEIDDPAEVANLLLALRAAGAREAVETLLARTHTVPLEDPASVARLVEVLQEVDPQKALPALLGRDPAQTVRIENQKTYLGYLRSSRKRARESRSLYSQFG